MLDICKDYCYAKNNSMKITLVLHNIRSIYNVGAILRTADGLGVEQVVYSGYTPSYDDASLLPHLRAKLNRQIAKAALGAEQSVAQARADDLAAWLAEKRAAGSTLVGLENNLEPSEQRRKIMLGEQRLDSKISELVLLLGEEVHGIPPEIRAKMDYFLEIPMVGKKESFNVSVATAIALWGLRH